MHELHLGTALDIALADAMAEDERVLLLGEDVRMLHSDLYARFGPQRVLDTPISESAFLGAAVGAAMAGLRPVVELMMVDFVAVALDALLNQAAKLAGFTGGRWTCPLVIRAPCGAGYGDGGQHGQALWGMLAGIPGLVVAVPSTPTDAYGLMRSAIAHPGPVVVMEHKLLSASWLEYLGRGGRESVRFDVPRGATGPVRVDEPPIPLGKARIVKPGEHITAAGVGVSMHRAVEAAALLSRQGIDMEVLDLRTLRPMDTRTLIESVGRTGRLLVVDEDYREFGLSGELAAVVLEAGLQPAYRRVAVTDTLPYARHLESEALPHVGRIMREAQRLVGVPTGTPAPVREREAGPT